MKYLILIFILITNCFFVNAQDKRYTKGAENGYVWISLSQLSNTLSDYKHDYLASLLENQKIKKMSGLKPFPLFNCDKDIIKLDDSKQSIDLDVVIKMIDQFYERDENLIIPIIGAYCYCIKELAGYSDVSLKSYKEKLLEFSKSDFKK